MTEISVSFNGAPMSELSNLVSGEVETAINLPSRFRLVFADPVHTLVSDLTVTLGSAVSISSGTTVLMVGEVTALEAEYDTNLGTQLIVRGYDKLHRLQTGRAAQVFAPESAFGDIVSLIAADAGLTPGDTSGAPTSPAPWLGQRNISSWDLLLSLAEEAGAVISVTAEGSLNFVKPTQASTGPQPATPASLATLPDPLQLVPDNNLLRVRAVVSGNQQPTEVQVRSWDASNNAAIVGTATATTSGVAATYGPADASAMLAGTTFVDARTSIPDQGSATTLAGSLADRIGAGVGEIEGIAVLSPQMKAGVAVSLGNLGSPFDGQYVLSSVRHQFSARTGDRTFFSATGRQDRTILGLTGGGDAAKDRRANRFAGVVNGIVTDISDPNQMGRVKVKVGIWDDSFVADWARVVQVGAGSSHGAFLPPNVGDEVLLAFENNDLRRPVVLGGLYNGHNTPLLGDAESLIDNGSYTRRGIVSTLGDMLIFFDGASKEGISLLTSDKQLKLALNKTTSQIAITASASGAKVMITSNGDITLQSQSGDVSIQGNNVKIQANQQFSAQSSAGMSLQDSSSVAIKGASVAIN